MSRFLRSLAVVVAFVPVVVTACADDPPPTHLQPSDLGEPEGGAPEKFDRNKILEAAAFTDSEALSAKGVQDFLAKTPYGGRPSFLETYQSNGIRAADAIVLVARQYRINPLVLLVYTQAVEGLIGERFYPFPVQRVEYVFRCGCFTSKECSPELAGFDRQLDCLGRSLRDAMEQIKTNEETAAGWGVGKKTFTLDNRDVRPESIATAAIYNETPRVAEGQAGGTWLLWNLWNHYSYAVGYSGAFGSADGRWVGEPCTTAEVCSTDIEGALCAVSEVYPDGFCTAECDADRPCPSDPSKAETFCTKFDEGGVLSYFCLPVCNAAAGAASCRQGYECKARPGLADGQRDVCGPAD